MMVCMSPTPEILDRARKIKLFLMDVDGTLTDGSVNLISLPDNSGVAEMKTFNSQDGAGLKLAQIMGKGAAFLWPPAFGLCAFALMYCSRKAIIAAAFGLLAFFSFCHNDDAWEGPTLVPIDDPPMAAAITTADDQWRLGFNGGKTQDGPCRRPRWRGGDVLQILPLGLSSFLPTAGCWRQRWRHRQGKPRRRVRSAWLAEAPARFAPAVLLLCRRRIAKNETGSWTASPAPAAIPIA